MTNSNIRSRLSRNILLASALLGFGFATAVFAETVYIWRDSNGVRQYADACPTGQTCRTRDIGTMSKRRQEKLRDLIDTSTTSSDTTDTSTTASSDGTTTGGTTGDTTSTDGTTSTTGDTSTEPTPDQDNGSTTAGDTTTDTPTDNIAALEWDAVNDPDLVGYRVYHAVAGGAYPPFGSGISAGSSTSITISRLDSGNRYYFRVTAVDNAGNESGFSNEVYKDIP